VERGIETANNGFVMRNSLSCVSKTTARKSLQFEVNTAGSYDVAGGSFRDKKIHDNNSNSNSDYNGKDNNSYNNNNNNRDADGGDVSRGKFSSDFKKSEDTRTSSLRSPLLDEL